MTEHHRVSKQPGQFEANQDTSGSRPAAPDVSDHAGQAGSNAADRSHGEVSEPRPSSRSGLDSRRRGWYWHWNEIITQYAPLIGLKGIGLLNSYTAWTDRRDNSPHRGYAFPSQQTEGAFYGEDRAELITINKILVALDLVEIRKEMVQRTDEQGHNWRVPHNFYRVKDRTGGLTLTTADVIRVAELADRDKAVYRYLRRLFSPKFKPIDRDNVWHAILREIAGHPTWQKLTARAAGQEARTSARSRAGHKKRPAKRAASDDSKAEPTGDQSTDTALGENEQQPDREMAPTTDVDAGNRASPADVDGANIGSEEVVAPGNNGLTGNEETIDDGASKGRPGNVEQSNTMYYQESTTTTTTTSTNRSESGNQPDDDNSGFAPANSGSATDSSQAPPGGSAERNDQQAASEHPNDGPLEPPPSPEKTPLGPQSRSDAGSGPASERGADSADSAGPLGDPSPLVVSLFEAANNRRSSPLERILLSELERDADPAARATGATGADWVAAALREAVASGSSFVAPKRAREIITRWSRGGRGPGGQSLIAGSREERAAAPAHAGGDSGHRDVAEIWDATLKRLARSLDRESLDRWFVSSRLLEYLGGTARIRVESQAAADKLSRDYRSLVERALRQEVGRSVSACFVAGDSQALAESTEPRERSDDRIVISPADHEQGRQLWQAIIDELRTGLPPNDVNRMRGVVPLGQNEAGDLVLGTPNQLVQQLIGARYRGRVEAAVSAVLGTKLRIQPLGHNHWSVAES